MAPSTASFRPRRAGPRLSHLQLNRTTLARQHLIERSQTHDVVEMVEALAGLNAQDVYQPYVSLWSRLPGFRKAALEEALRERHLVRATLFRSTLHIVSGPDHLRFWPVLRPVLLRALRGFFRGEADRLPLEALAEAARIYTRAEARTFSELRRHLRALAPEASLPSLSFAARALLPLVQVPPAGFWGSRQAPAYISAEHWLGGALGDPEEGKKELVRRYLRAFGPATPADLTAFVGMSLRETLLALRNELIEREGSDGQTCLDLPGSPLAEPEVPAPVRFLPPWDNLLLAHANRIRVLAEADRKRVILSGGRVQATFLVDGFVAGLWRWKVEGKRARLTLAPFRPLEPRVLEELHAEGEALLPFLVEDSTIERRDVVIENAAHS